jgi:D-glycero-D-manno-heptose 1,7-bisphosphate phosphatase
MRAVFLDRDGVICENRPDHVKTWDEFQFLPGAKNSLAALSRLGLAVVVVTNQAAIGRGMVSVSAVNEIHRHMMAEVAASGGRIDRIVYCPHRPEENCGCRKPKAGMLLQVANEMGIDLGRSYMIGDAASDLLAGQCAGCQTFMVLTGRGLQQLVPAFHSVNGQFTITRNLMGATTHILRAELSVADDVEMEMPSQSYFRALRPAHSF